jgi:hypothetical protein
MKFLLCGTECAPLAIQAGAKTLSAIGAHYVADNAGTVGSLPDIASNNLDISVICDEWRDLVLVLPQCTRQYVAHVYGIQHFVMFIGNQDFQRDNIPPRENMAGE